MAKALEDMSLEELWQLFPIFLEEHNRDWAAWYKEESRRIQSFLPANQLYEMHHIGSTSIEGIWAKPIIDILLEIPRSEDMGSIKRKLLEYGYLPMSESEGRMSFNKGYTLQGFAERIFHLHLRYYGDNDELYFRDYLKAHPAVAKDYERLKLILWKKYEYNRDAYTEAKTDFIRRYTQKAKKLYKRRYDDKIE